MKDDSNAVSRSRHSRASARRRAIAGALLLASSAGLACSAPKYFDVVSTGSLSIAAADQDLRFAIAGERIDDAGKRTLSCIEPVGPAMRLQNITLSGYGSAQTDSRFGLQGSGAGGGGDGGTNARGNLDIAAGNSANVAGGGSVNFGQSLAQIYQVGEIMQFVQEMSFRYCEAYVNGALAPQAYIDKVSQLTQTASDLMALQMGPAALAAYRETIATADSRLAQAQAYRQSCAEAVDADVSPCTNEATITAYLDERKDIAPARKKALINVVRAADTAHDTGEQLLKTGGSLLDRVGTVVPPKAPPK